MKSANYFIARLDFSGAEPKKWRNSPVLAPLVLYIGISIN
jgi:hypothetical protein